MALSFESPDRARRSHGQAPASVGTDRQPASVVLQWQRAAGNRAVADALQRQVFKPRPRPKDKRPEPEPSRPAPPPPKSTKRLDWQKTVVEPLRQALRLAKKGPRQFEAAAEIVDRVSGAVALFNDRLLAENRPEEATVYSLLKLIHSLYWELHVNPRKGKGTPEPYASDFPAGLADRATWIENFLKKRVATKPDESHLLGAWRQDFSADAKKIIDRIAANGLPKKALDSRILVNDLENMRNIALLVRMSVKDDPALQANLLVVVRSVTEHVVTTEQNMTGPNDVDIVTSHLITAEDVADELAPVLNKIQ